MRQKLFQRRFARITSDVIILDCDTSTTSTTSKNQREAVQGFNKANDGNPTIKTLILIDQETHTPLGFRKQPGNVSDIVSVITTAKWIRSMSFRPILFVGDHGFFSANNIFNLLHSGIHFLLRANTDVTWIRDCILEHIDELMSSNLICSENGPVKGITVIKVRTYSGVDDEGKSANYKVRLYVHIYVNMGRRAKHEAALLADIQSVLSLLQSGHPEDKLDPESRKIRETYLKRESVTKWGKTRDVYVIDDEAVNKSKRMFGVYATIGHGPPEEVRDTQVSHYTYLMRVRVEFHFRTENQMADGDAVRSWYGDNYLGRLTIQFVACTYAQRLYFEIDRVKK